VTAVDLLDSLLEPGGLSVRFQPVFELREQKRSVHYFEALTRGPRGTNMESAAVLFEYVRRKGREAEVDRICAASALRAASGPGIRTLSLNVHAATLERDPGFPAFLLGAAQVHGIETSGLTVEIVEHAPAWAGPGFLRAIAALRQGQIAIAMDDVGLGQSNYRMILDCRPDYFKIDRYIVTGCHADSGRQAILDSLVQLARKLGSRVVAEGVETAAEFHAVRLLGIDLIQGHYLAAAAPVSELSKLLGAS
jgi:EAL domain-containing protein (putative c-di-GMP-specific phosphodiesterase class I)